MRDAGLAYVIAVVATLGAGLLRWLLDPLLQDHLWFATYFLPAALAGYVGGFRPALLASGLGGILTWGSLVPHPLSIAYARAADGYAFMLYLILSLAIAGLGGAMHAARARSRAAEEFAQQQAGTLRATLESIGDAVIAADVSGTVTFLNRVAETLTAWTNEEAAGRPLSQVFAILNPSTRQPVGNPISKVLASGQVVRLANHTILVARDGTERPIDDSAAPVRDDQGQVVGVVLVFRDVTERQRAEVSRGHLAAIVESSSDPIVSKDLRGIVTSWNKAAERIFGYTAQEMVGRPIAVLIPEDHGDEEQEILQKIREGRRVDPHDTVRRRKDGTPVPVSVTVSPLFDADGRVIGASAIAHDITTLKEAAEALKEADRRKDEFLATLAHELRNPLAPIRNVVQVFEAENVSERDMKWGREVLARQVQIMSRLLEDLLEVSRISRNQLQIRQERVALADVIQAAIETSRPLIESGKHELTVSLPSEPIYVHADVLRLAQVFSNLLNNAAKYTDTGGHLRLAAEVRDSQVCVSVRDDGIGIERVAIPRLFEIFSQAASAQGRSQGGLGIGLSLARAVLTLHGGSIEAHSEGPGTGSEFIARLPIAAGPIEVGADTHDDGREAHAVPRRVLIVDDSQDGADALTLVLRLMGHAASAAYDGEAGLEAAERLRPEIMLLDIGMPGMNGYEVCRRIREQPWGQDMVLIALTGWGQEQDRRRSKASGFDHHLVKPVQPDELQKLLISAYSNPRADHHATSADC